MRQHLTINEYGQFIGVSGNRLTVKSEGNLKEYPLNRLKSVQIAKRGVSFSADVLTTCALHGIKVFILNFKGEIVSCLSGTKQHAVVKVRQKQFDFLKNPDRASLSAKIVHGKIRNQRATLLYFKKYHKNSVIDNTSQQLKSLTDQIQNKNWIKYIKWRPILLGLEGQAANLYWKCIASCELMPSSFKNRVGRQAVDAGNKALNYGYAILSSYVWNAIINAGLEPYAGFLHAKRAGKPSLVLDLMEEYRAWLVDRNIIKLREALNHSVNLDIKTRGKIINNIHKTFQTKYHYKKKKMRLESILQRQVYILAGTFAEDKKYRPYYFKW